MKKLLDRYSSAKIKTLIWEGVIVSLVISMIAVAHVNGVSMPMYLKKVLIFYFPMIYVNLAPIMLVFRSRSIKRIKENPIAAIILIFYFLLFLPVFMGLHFQKTGEVISDDEKIFYVIVMFFNFFSIVVSHVILIKYVFLDIVFKKKRPTGQDTLIILLTYISMGVSFGFIYAVITVTGEGNAFGGMDRSMVADIGNLKLYLRHIYFSFITLTSVGFGDISPITWPAQLAVVVESVLGVLLLSFSLGIILSSEIEEKHKRLEDKDEEFKREVLQEIDKVIERKLKERKK